MVGCLVRELRGIPELGTIPMELLDPRRGSVGTPERMSSIGVGDGDLCR